MALVWYDDMFETHTRRDGPVADVDFVIQIPGVRPVPERVSRSGGLEPDGNRPLLVAV